MITTLQNYKEYPTKIHSIDENLFNDEISIIELEIIRRMEINSSDIPTDFARCLSFFVFYEYCQSVQSKAVANVGETESAPEITIYSPKLQVNAWNLGADLAKKQFDSLIKNCEFKTKRELWR
jgi:hypothetical protein